MATKLFLRDAKGNAIGVFRDLLIEAGSGVAPLGEISTAASGTELQWKNNGQTEVLEWISGRVPVGGFTLAGTVSFSIWARESNMNANCGARARLFKRTAAGAESEIGGGPYNDGVEFGTAAGEFTWTGTPTSTAFAEDDRLIVRFYITNVGTMASGHTCSLDYAAPDASQGDSFIQITENVTFKPDLSAVENDSSLQWNMLSTAQQDSTLQWSALTSAQQNSDLRWNMDGSVSADSTLQWSALASAQQDSTLQWGLNTIAQQDSTLQWSALTAAQQDSELRWSMGGAVSADSTLQWNSLSTAQQDSILQWGLNTIVQQDSTLQWNLLLAAQQDSELRWGVYGGVASDSSLRWNALSTAQQDSILQWGLNTFAQQGAELRWDLAQALQRDQELRWNLDGVISNDLTLVWGIGIFTFIPSYSTARKQAPRLHRAQFGDRAFAVREKEGINHNGQVWDLVFTDVPKSVAEEISNFIQGNKGTTPFTWVTPDGDTLSFVCSGVRLTGVDSRVFSLSMTFEQDFSP